MLRKKIVSMAVSTLLVASPVAMAEETHHPEEGTATVAAGVPAATPAATGSAMASPGGMTMGPGMSKGGMTMGRGMGKGGMTMGAQQGQGGGMGMMHGGKGGGIGMMHGGKGGGMGMMHGGKGGMMGHGMDEKYRKLIGRLDLLEAQMAKIETMLERLLER